MQTLFNATRDFQHSTVKCICQNDIGMSSDTETLDIICKCGVTILRHELIIELISHASYRSAIVYKIT